MRSRPTAGLPPGGPKKLTSRQLRYQKRRQAGLCCYGTCSAETKDGRAFCTSHLRRMVTQVSTIYERRAARKLCFRCGMRPQFWGKRCVICRQLVARDPLPRGAKAALRKYRQREAQYSRELSREAVRAAGRELVAGGSLTGRQQEALQLYLGLEDNGWRTHGQVAELMNLSAERVRQLLLPAKTALASALGQKVRRRPATKNRKRSESRVRTSKRDSTPTEARANLGGGGKPLSVPGHLPTSPALTNQDHRRSP